MDLYREEILEHWQNPLNFGVMDKPDVVVEQVNPLCGDEVTFYFKLQKAREPKRQRDTKYSSSDSEKSKRNSSHSVRTIITDVRFTGSGCAISMASASMLSEAIKGKPVSQLEKITGQDVLGLIGGPSTSSGFPPARLKCAFLALEALRKLRVNS